KNNTREHKFKNNTNVTDDINKIMNFDPTTFFTKKEMIYYKKINKFYKMCSEDQITKMLDIISGKSTISLRSLDWFVTRFSKKGIEFIKENCKFFDDFFDVHVSYKSELKSYKKKYFDPFKRRKKFYYE